MELEGGAAQGRATLPRLHSKEPEVSGALPDTLRAAFEALVAQGGEPKFRCGRDGAWSLNYTPPPKDDAAPPRRDRLRFTAFDDAGVTDDPEYLIEGILPREGMGVVYAPPKAHKTFTVFDMAMHIALGRPYRGRAVQCGSVVYNVFEGQHGFLKRAVAYRQHHLKNHVERVPLLIQSTRLNLAKDVDKLIVGVKAEEIAPALVILDTLNRSLVGSESKDADMAGYLAAADKLRAESERRRRGRPALQQAGDSRRGVRQDFVRHRRGGETGGVERRRRQAPWSNPEAHA